MNPADMELFKQLPIVGLFLLVIFKIQKDQREYLEKRDLEYSKSIQLLAGSLRLMSNRVYGLGLAFVALAGENDPTKGAKAAKKIMEDLANSVDTSPEHRPGYGMGD